LGVPATELPHDTPNNDNALPPIHLPHFSFA